ncbi:MAG: hypothetical protein ACRDNY_11130 [Gaiellaceae bacterium]
MDEVLGLLLLAGYIAGIVGLAAAITFTVIKIFPTERSPKEPDKPDTPAANEGARGAGSLFRRSKRGTT